MCTYVYIYAQTCTGLAHTLPYSTPEGVTGKRGCGAPYSLSSRDGRRPTLPTAVLPLPPLRQWRQWHSQSGGGWGAVAAVPPSPPFSPSSLSLSAHLPRAVGARRAAIHNGTGHDRAAVNGYRCRGPLRPVAASITPATPAAAAAASAALWAPTPLSFPAVPPLSPPNPTHRFRPP